jgi:hypothetical protein
MKLRRSLYARPESSEESSAPRRRLAAGGATQRLASDAAGSLALAGGLTAEPSWLPSARVCRPQQHGSTSQRRRGARMFDAHCALLAPSASSVSVRLSSVHPSSVRRPVRVHIRLSGVRASGVRYPGVRVRSPEPRVRRRVSGVRGERPASRTCRVCVRSLRTGEFVEREGAAGSHTSRTGAVGVSPHRIRVRLVGAQVEVWCLELAALAAAASAGPRPPSWSARVVARLDRLVDRDTPVARRIARLQSSRCAEVRPLGQAACRSAGACCRRGAGHDLSPWVVVRPRWEAVWPTARACAAPPRPKAAGGPSTAVRPGGETRSDLGEPWWACRYLNLGPS